MGYIYGYNRVSTKEQHDDRGNKNIEDFCKRNNYKLEKIFVDKQTGRNFDRARYLVLKEDVLRSGDILIVPEYDRLGRASETKEELECFKKNNIRVIFLDIPTTQMDLDAIPDEMSRLIMNCINDMLISFYDLMSKTELQRKKKRQYEGIQAKKDRGEWEDYGRPRIMNSKDFAIQYKRVEGGEIIGAELMRQLNLNCSTFYRYVREYRKLKERKNNENDE